jgi:hypothetical protein
VITIELVPTFQAAGGRDLSQLSETAGGALGFGTVETSITSEARSPKGFAYFWAVDRGRRGFSAQPGKVLRFEIGGQVFYRKSVGPSQPRNITQKALAALDQNMRTAAQAARGGDLHAWLASFLNGLVDFEAISFQQNTPNVTGKLASKYEVHKAQ